MHSENGGCTVHRDKVGTKNGLSELHPGLKRDGLVVKCKLPKPENLNSMARTHVKMPGMISIPGRWKGVYQPVGKDYSEAQASERPDLKK